MGPEHCSDQTLTVMGMQLVGLMANINYERAYTLFGPEMKVAMSVRGLEAAWEGLIEKHGRLQGLTGTRCEKEGSFRVVYVSCAFSSGSLLDVKVVFSDIGEVNGLWFIPAAKDYEPPEYVDESAFSEMDCNVGEYKLPGKVTMPAGEGPFPAVVLVHGSGPNDMDETLWETKVFRDLSWGLSSNGVAALRYDKRTKERPDLFEPSMRFTVFDEVVEDGVAGVDLISSMEGVDPCKVFVLGHSLGGMMAPRIASLDERVAGIIIMAGDAGHLEDAFLEQIEYLINLDGKVEEKEAALLVETKETAKKIKELDIEDGEHVLGAGREYWEDLETYDQMEVAASLNIPMLVLQGERDYQVTIEDFEQWMHALSDIEDVTFKSYPDLNHLMISGKGPSVPQEYTMPGHLEGNLLYDIISWIASRR